MGQIDQNCYNMAVRRGPKCRKRSLELRVKGMKGEL